MNAVQKLRSVADDIAAAAEPLKVVDGWALAGRLLARMPVDQGEVGRVVSEKDVEGLDALVRGLESPGGAGGSAGAGASAREDAGGGAGPGEGGGEGGYEAATLQAAMKAFKKRLKLGRLADESRLGGRYTSGGRASKIDAIRPPSEFEDGVWRQLAREGRLVDMKQGFYGLPSSNTG